MKKVRRRDPSWRTGLFVGLTPIEARRCAEVSSSRLNVAETELLPAEPTMSSQRTPEQRVRLFVDRVERTMATRPGVREGTVHAHFKIEANADRTVFETTVGDEEHMRSLLLDFRPFVSPGEDLYFNHVCNLIERHLTVEELRATHRYNRAVWKAVTTEGDIGLHVNGVNYTPERCFDLVVNGDIFHLDEQKAAEYASLPEPMRAWVHNSMVGMVINGFRVLIATRNLVVDAFGRDALVFDTAA